MNIDDMPAGCVLVTESDQLTSEDIAKRIADYERAFGMSSEELLEKARDGTAPDTYEVGEWLILLRHR